MNREPNCRRKFFSCFYLFLAISKYLIFTATCTRNTPQSLFIMTKVFHHVIKNEGDERWNNKKTIRGFLRHLSTKEEETRCEKRESYEHELALCQLPKWEEKILNEIIHHEEIVYLPSYFPSFSPLFCRERQGWHKTRDLFSVEKEILLMSFIRKIYNPCKRKDCSRVGVVGTLCIRRFFSAFPARSG